MARVISYVCDTCHKVLSSFDDGFLLQGKILESTKFGSKLIVHFSSEQYVPNADPDDSNGTRTYDPPHSAWCWTCFEAARKKV